MYTQSAPFNMFHQHYVAPHGSHERAALHKHSINMCICSHNRIHIRERTRAQVMHSIMHSIISATKLANTHNHIHSIRMCVFSHDMLCIQRRSRTNSRPAPFTLALLSITSFGSPRCTSLCVCFRIDRKPSRECVRVCVCQFVNYVLTKLAHARASNLICMEWKHLVHIHTHTLAHGTITRLIYKHNVERKRTIGSRTCGEWVCARVWVRECVMVCRFVRSY